jgi:hypothetical protein
MTTELEPTKPEDKKIEIHARGGGSDTVYALGIIGAWVFYYRSAATNQEKVMGFLKGLVWPAFLVYSLFNFLNPKDE